MELPNRPTKDPYQEIPIKDYSYVNTQKSPTKRDRHTTLWVVIGVLVLILLGAGAFAYGHYTKDKASKPPTSSSHKQVASSKSTKTSTTAPNIPLTSYTSSTFNLTANYPTSWSVVANGTTSLSFVSPEMSLVADSGKSVEGKISVSIFNQSQVPAAFGSSSEAVLNSQDINFNSPTPNQAAQTYISFVQYPATTVIGGMDGIYVTGNNGYLKDQAIPASNISSVSPLILADFTECADQTCASPTPLTVSSTMWSSSSFSTPILDIFKSLTFE